MNQVIRIKQWGVRQQGSGFNNHLKVQGWEERRHGGFGESWLGEKRGNRNYNLDGARAKQPHLAVDMEDHQATYCPGRVRPACSSSACSRGTGSPCLHADLRLRKTAVPLPLQLRAILAAGKMAEEQASGAASLAGDDDWDAGELTRTMAAHGQRPAAGRRPPRASSIRPDASCCCSAAGAPPPPRPPRPCGRWRRGGGARGRGGGGARCSGLDLRHKERISAAAVDQRREGGW